MVVTGHPPERWAVMSLVCIGEFARLSPKALRLTPVQVAEAKALACQLPAETGTPLPRWSYPELAAELTTRGITDTISASTVRHAPTV